MNEYATTSEVAQTLGVSVPRIHALISQERIVGAKKVGSNRGTWLIPVDGDGMPSILPSRERPRAFKKIGVA
jgi:hypothetical protein